MIRATTSVPPPAGYGTVMWIGFVGQSCAAAGAITRHKKQSNAANAATDFLIDVPSQSRAISLFFFERRDCSADERLDKARNDANNGGKTGGAAAMSTNMSTKSLSPEAMEKRVAR